MIERTVDTTVGRVTVYLSEKTTSVPFVFLHGVYLDHSIWNNIIEDSFFSNQSFILIDMPLHGKSKEIHATWDLDQCAKMLLEILEALHVESVIAVGHSWGSMVILRSAHLHPEKFNRIILCNMPYEKLSPSSKLLVKLRHSMLTFSDFYYHQAAKSMMAKSSIQMNPHLLETFISMMSTLSKDELKKTDQEVLLNAADTSHLIHTLKIPTVMIKGKEDYVPLPSLTPRYTISGGHISPLEAPQEVISIIKSNVRL